MTPKRPRQRKSPRKRSTPAPIERMIPIRIASELLPFDEDEEARRLLIDDSGLRGRRLEMIDAVLPLRSVPAPSLYATGLYASDDLLYEPEQDRDPVRDLAREDIDDRGEN